MIHRIRSTLEARIASERGKQVKRTAGYSNDEEALRQEFGMGPGPGGFKLAGGVADERRGIVDTGMALSREPAMRHAIPKNLPDLEDRGNHLSIVCNHVCI